MIAIPEKRSSVFQNTMTSDPADLKLKDIIKLLPRDCFEKNTLKAVSYTHLTLPTILRV